MICNQLLPFTAANAVRGGDDGLAFEQDLLYLLNGELVYVDIGIALWFAWQLVCLQEDVDLFNPLAGLVRPRIYLWNGMQFPVEGLGGKCDTEFVIGAGLSFPTGP